MTHTTPAQVTTLTASVTTLQMGSKQVTLSVARQLDVIPFEDIEPWGKIRIRPVPDKYTEVIGRSKIDGTLCRAIEDAETVDVWHMLPLIVLAGLK